MWEAHNTGHWHAIPEFDSWIRIPLRESESDLWHYVIVNKCFTAQANYSLQAVKALAEHRLEMMCQAILEPDC